LRAIGELVRRPSISLLLGDRVGTERMTLVRVDGSMPRIVDRISGLRGRFYRWRAALSMDAVAGTGRCPRP
jgi:hypothetical protein